MTILQWTAHLASYKCNNLLVRLLKGELTSHMKMVKMCCTNYLYNVCNISKLTLIHLFI